MNIPFNANQGLIIVPAELFGPTGSIIIRLALDTGATGTMINAAPLVTIGYEPSSETKRIPVTTGSRVEFVPRIIVSSIFSLAQIRLNFPVLAHTLPPSANVDGLLGLDFYREQILTINFQKGVIELK